MGIVQVWPEVRDNAGKWHLIMKDELGPCAICSACAPEDICYVCNNTGQAPLPFYSRYTPGYEPSKLAVLMSASLNGFRNIPLISDGVYPIAIENLSEDLEQHEDNIMRSYRKLDEDGDEIDADIFRGVAPMQSLVDYGWTEKKPVTVVTRWKDYQSWNSNGRVGMPQPDAGWWQPEGLIMTESEADAFTSSSQRFRDRYLVNGCFVAVPGVEISVEEWVPGFAEAVADMTGVAPPHRTRAVLIQVIRV